MCSVNNNLNSDCRCACNNITKYDTVIKSCCIIYLLLLSSLDIQSQDICDKSISGKVINKETKSPLPDVIVRAISDPKVYGNRVLYNSSDKFSISDENGVAIIQVGDAEGKNGEYDNNYVWVFKFKDGLIYELREYNSDLLVAERLYDYKLIKLD